MKKFFFSSVVIVTVVSLVAAEQVSSARASIDACYKKVCVAMELKYLDGLFSIRNRGFEGFNDQGQLLDLTSERQRYQELYDVAHNVSEVYIINSFREVDSQHVVCEVHQMVTFKIMEPGTEKLTKVILDSTSVDGWIKSNRGWRQQSSRVKSQILRKPSV